MLDMQTARENMLKGIVMFGMMLTAISAQFYVTDKKISRITTPILAIATGVAYGVRRATDEHYLLDSDQKKLLFVSKFLGNVREMRPICNFSDIREARVMEGQIRSKNRTDPAWGLELILNQGAPIVVLPLARDSEQLGREKKVQIDELLGLQA